MRLRLVPEQTSFDFFKYAKITFGMSILAMILSVVVFFTAGLNFGIDFRGGTTIRTESTQPLDVGVYRDALQPLGLGDVKITQVFDPTFADDQYVAMIRIEAQEGDESVASATVQAVEEALQAVDPPITFPSKPPSGR